MDDELKVIEQSIKCGPVGPSTIATLDECVIGCADLDDEDLEAELALKIEEKNEEKDESHLPEKLHEDDKLLAAELQSNENGSHSPSGTRVGMLLYALSTFCISTMVCLAKMVSDATNGVPVMQVVLCRCFVAMSIGLPMLAHERTNPFGHHSRRWMLLLRGCLGSGAVISMLVGAHLLPLSDAIVLGYTMPLWSALLGYFFLGEALSRWVAVAFVGCVVGVILIARPSTIFGGVALPLDGVAIASFQAILSAGAKVCVRVLGKGGEHPQVIIFYLVLTGAILSGAWLVLSHVVIMPSLVQCALLLGVGIFAFFGQTLATHGLKLCPLGPATAMTYFGAIWATAYGAIFFKESPDMLSFVGAFLIIACTAVLTMSKPQK